MKQTESGEGGGLRWKIAIKWRCPICGAWVMTAKVGSTSHRCVFCKVRSGIPWGSVQPVYQVVDVSEPNNQGPGPEGMVETIELVPDRPKPDLLDLEVEDRLSGGGGDVE